MKPSQVVALVLFVAIVMWGSLYFTILTVASRQNKTISAIKGVADQDNAILKAQRQTVADLGGKIADSQAHDDCLFKIATTPHTTTNPPVVADPSRCNLTTPSIVASPIKPVTPSPAPTSSSQTSPHEAGGSGQASPQAAPTPKPPHPLLCTLTLKLIGCKG